MKPPIPKGTCQGATVNKRGINNTVAFTVKHYTDANSLPWNENLIFFKLQDCRLCFLHMGHPILPRTHQKILPHTKGIQNTYTTKKNTDSTHVMTYVPISML